MPDNKDSSVDRLREALAWLLTCVAAAVIVAVLVMLRSKNGARERLLIGLVMLVLLFISGVESYFATSKIQSSRKQLRSRIRAQNANSLHVELHLDSKDESTWMDKVSRRASDLAAPTRPPT